MLNVAKIGWASRIEFGHRGGMHRVVAPSTAEIAKTAPSTGVLRCFLVGFFRPRSGQFRVLLALVDCKPAKKGRPMCKNTFFVVERRYFFQIQSKYDLNRLIQSQFTPIRPTFSKLHLSRCIPGA